MDKHVGFLLTDADAKLKGVLVLGTDLPIGSDTGTVIGASFIRAPVGPRR